MGSGTTAALPCRRSVRTAAEDFRRPGYRTAAFVSGFPLDRRFGFDRGFETYDDHLPKGNDRRRTPYVERFADATTDAALRWVATPSPTGSASRWFLWVHYYDPHAPYEPPADLAERFRHPYDGEIAFVDRQLDACCSARGRRTNRPGRSSSSPPIMVRAWANTARARTASSSTTRRFACRGSWRARRFAADRVSRTVARSIDVLPTLVDYAGLPRPSDVDGRSLRPAADGHEMTDAPSYAESLYPELELGWAPLYAWRVGGLKFIKAPRPELYDLTRTRPKRPTV